jgi:hypothetical protein
MDIQQQKLEREKSERELEKSAARLRMLEARTQKRRAVDAAPEVAGLHTVHDRLREQLRGLKNADQAVFDDTLDQMKRGNDSFSRALDAAADRLDRLDEANDRWLDAETDQLGGAFQLFIAWLGEEWVDDKQAAAQAQNDAQSAWQDVEAKRKGLREAVPEKKEEARAALQDSLANVRQKVASLKDRLRKRGARAPEQRS